MAPTDMTTLDASDGFDVHLRRESTAEQVAAALRDLIVRGRLAPGRHLPEGPLSQQLGVSRNTVREATHILASEGLITREIHRGAYVTRLDGDDVRDLYRVRRLVETTAVRELAGRRNDVAPLRAVLDAMARASAAGDVIATLDAVIDFHRTLIELMDSERLGALFASLEGELRLCVALSGTDEVRPEQLVKEHRALLRALERGDQDKAVSALLAHLGRTEERLAAALDRQFGPGTS